MQMVQWRFLDTGKGGAFFHMGLDEAILDAVRRGESPPTFRIYSWAPPAITLGHSQDAGRALDLRRCERDGVPVTRRLTGGRAVFHANELTYSMIGPADDPVFGGTLTDTYRAVSRVLMDALTGLGAYPEWSRGEPVAGRTGIGSSPCFLSASRYEITIGGRKLVGSAQRRMEGYFLQQGSILTGPGHERIADYLADGADSGYMRAEMALKSTDLAAALGHDADPGRLARLLADSLERTAGIEVNHDELSPRERECAYRLSEARYASKGWVIGHGE